MVKIKVEREKRDASPRPGTEGLPLLSQEHSATLGRNRSSRGSSFVLGPEPGCDGTQNGVLLAAPILLLSEWIEDALSPRVAVTLCPHSAWRSAMMLRYMSTCV